MGKTSRVADSTLQKFDIGITSPLKGYQVIHRQHSVYPYFCPPEYNTKNITDFKTDCKQYC